MAKLRVHSKKRLAIFFPVLSQDVINQTLSSQLLPPKESVVSVITAGDGKIGNFF
jgi:hypothetical protein